MLDDSKYLTEEELKNIYCKAVVSSLGNYESIYELIQSCNNVDDFLEVMNSTSDRYFTENSENYYRDIYKMFR